MMPSRNVDHSEKGKRTTRWRNSSSRTHERTELGKDMKHKFYLPLALEGLGGPHKEMTCVAWTSI